MLTRAQQQRKRKRSTKQTTSKSQHMPIELAAEQKVPQLAAEQKVPQLVAEHQELQQVSDIIEETLVPPPYELTDAKKQFDNRIKAGQFNNLVPSARQAVEWMNEQLKSVDLEPYFKKTMVEIGHVIEKSSKQGFFDLLLLPSAVDDPSRYGDLREDKQSYAKWYICCEFGQRSEDIFTKIKAVFDSINESGNDLYQYEVLYDIHDESIQIKWMENKP